MSVMMRRFERQAPPPPTQDSGSPPVVPSHETPIVPNQKMPSLSIQINMPQPVPQFDHLESPQYEEEILVGIDKKPSIRLNSLKDSSSK